MLYKTHIATSLMAGTALSSLMDWTVLSSFFNMPYTAQYVLGLLLGSILPDIDHPESFLGRRSLGLATIINQKFGHRGLTHSFVICLLMSVPVYLMHSLFWAGVWFGCIFHIIGDYFSTGGVPLLAPIINKRYKALIRYRIGGTAETIIMFVALLLIVVLLAMNDLLDELTSSFLKLLSLLYFLS